MGYVYVLETECGVKIGIAEHSVEQRLSGIRTGCPVEITRVWQSRNIPEYKQCERILHQFFKSYNMRGEWFSIDFSLAVFEAQKVCSKNVDGAYVEQRYYEVAQKNEQLQNQCEKQKIQLEAASKQLEELLRRNDQLENKLSEYKQLEKRFGTIKDIENKLLEQAQAEANIKFIPDVFEDFFKQSYKEMCKSTRKVRRND